MEYELVPIDIFAAEGPPRSYLTRHPFGRIPAFEHAGFSLYETSAIARYVDEVFEGPKLQPSGARERARCNQLISVADNYAYPQLVWGIYVERLSKPGRGAVTDEAKIAATIPKAIACLKAMSDLMGDNPWLAGTEITLADLYAAPMFDYFLMTPEGRVMIQRHEPGHMVVPHCSEAINEGNYTSLRFQKVGKIHAPLCGGSTLPTPARVSIVGPRRTSWETAGAPRRPAAPDRLAPIRPDSDRGTFAASLHREGPGMARGRSPS